MLTDEHLQCKNHLVKYWQLDKRLAIKCRAKIILLKVTILNDVRIKDRIYGDIKITSTLIAELIRSEPLQRLKRISQDGATHFILPVFNGNHFEHSIGAWYLAYYFDRPLEEQAACLLHDVPHTAFSHVVDFVMDNHEQEYHDKFLKRIVLNSEIPGICGKHGIDINKVLKKEDYYLLDNRTPELSFDRWDYFMRDGYMLGLLPFETIRLLLKSAKLQDDRFYFEDIHVASQLCIASFMVCQLGYVNPTAHGFWFLLANALKLALREGVISEQDFATTDDKVWQKLRTAGNKEVRALLNRLKSGRTFMYAPKNEAEFYGRNKARYIDPDVMHEGRLKPTSQLIVGLTDYIQGFKEACQYIGVIQI